MQTFEYETKVILGQSPPLRATQLSGATPLATLSTLVQVMGAFLVAGFGNVGAGLILDYVKEWPVFLHVNELFILVPTLLGLKGNLEMTMASRLSTQANLGHMDDPYEVLKMAKGNLALVQCQATVVSFVVAMFASFVKSFSCGSGSYLSGDDNDNGGQLSVAGVINATAVAAAATATTGQHPGNQITNHHQNITQTIGAALNQQQQQPGAVSANLVEGFDWNNALILCASSLLTANIACFVLGTMMILVIVGSHRCRIDPDNVASPVAASLGDMTTAALLAVIAHSIYHYSEDQRYPYLALVITILFLFMLPIWVSVARNNPYTSHVVTKGWTPIVIAVFISSCGGFILEYGKSRFSRLPVFQPVINGVGGNLVAVQASRLSTSLHRHGKPGDQVPISSKIVTNPVDIFLSSRRVNDINVKTARLLLLMSIPAHLLYFFVIRAIENSTSTGSSATTSASAATISTTATTAPGVESAFVPVSVLFLTLYMLFAVAQVALLLYMAQNLVSLLWRCAIDPDNYATPILTALGDLLGCAFLFVVFVIAYQFNDPYALTTE